MDSTSQPLDMANYYHAADTLPSAPGDLPLSGSVHAMVPYPSMPVSVQIPDAEFTYRMARLEQQQFQEGLNSHYRSAQTSQSLQHLQQQLRQMQQAIIHDIPALRRQVQILQAKLDRKYNDECTRNIQIPLRSQEQKVQSARRNANLRRIHTNACDHHDGTPGSINLRRAEQMEALAKSLRGRVHYGGLAYLLEAEDAEAWAAKLREDINNTPRPEVENKLLENGDFESKIVDSSHRGIADANPQVWGQPCSETAQGWDLAPQSDWAIASVSKRTVHRTTDASPSGLNQNTTYTGNGTSTPAHSFSPKDSIYPHTPSAQRSVSLQCSAPVPSFKIKESPESKVSPVQVEAAPELRTRRLAPHLKYAIQKTQASKQATPEIKGTVPPPNSTQVEQKASPAQDRIVSVKNEGRKKNKKCARHRRVTSARSKTPKPPQVQPVWTVNKDEPWPSEATRSNVFSAAEAMEQPEVHETPKVETEKKSSQKAEDEFPLKKQDDFISTLNLETASWQPTYLRELPLPSPSELKDIPSSSEMHAFNRTFITAHLGGMKWLPSFYSVPEPELSLLPGRGYYLLEDSTEPLAPPSPGAHGSLVTPILRLPESDNPSTPKPESMQHAPLFIKRGDGYVYYGMYSHLRSDRLDLERCNTLIPEYLKEHWAAQLTSPKRPKWVTEALQTHLRPPPTFPRPSSSASSDAITHALDQHHRALESWHRDTSLLTSFLRPANILSAFASPDTGAAVPGLRFWCLGLKCEGWDKGFYDMMIREEKVWAKEGKRDGEKEREQRKDMLRILGNRKPVRW